MSILLTGGLGFIGSHLAVELIKTGHKVIIVDNLCNSSIDILVNIEKITAIKPAFYQIDITDHNKFYKVFVNHKIDIVIHLAGHKAVGESVKDPLKYYQNNIVGLNTLLRYMNEYNVKKLIFSSSATVYGNPKTLPLTEDSEINILNPYGQTKYMSELILQDCAKAYGLSVISLRYFNPVGSRKLLTENPINEANNLFPVIISVCTGKKDHLEVFGSDYDTIDGSAIRDYIHVVDLAKGHLQALKHLNPGFEIFNLGTGIGYSVLDIINKFEHHLGKKLPYIMKDRREGDSAIVYADCSKANIILNWKTEYNLDDMVRSTLLSNNLIDDNLMDNNLSNNNLNKFTTTFVTGFWTIKGFNVPNKSVDIYFGHFMKLVRTGIPLSVYISPEYKDRLEAIAKENDNVKIAKVIDIKDTWVYNTVNIPNIRLPDNRNPIKDTLEFFVSQNNKIECVADTIEKNPFNTEFFAWIDFGVQHVFKNEEEASKQLKQIAISTFVKDKVIFPGCWEKANYNYLNGVCWRFAGGFFLGYKNTFIDMWNRYQTYLSEFIKKYNLMTWEVNIWMSMEIETNWDFHWYKADHDNSLINIPSKYYIKNHIESINFTLNNMLDKNL